MKRMYVLLLVAVAAGTCLMVSCRKNQADVLTEQTATEKLVASESFSDFSKTFIPDFLAMANYHRSILRNGGKQDFIMQLANAGMEETEVRKVYQKFSLDFDQSILLRNKVDNDLLLLLSKNPYLLSFDDEKIKTILINAMQIGLHADDQRWAQTKIEINRNLSLNGNGNTITKSVNGVGVTKVGEITIDEVWDCMKQAVGFGSASILGIAGLKQLAKDGIQQAVIGVSKWLAKKAGWIGVAVTLLDFGSCVYTQAND